MATALPQPGTSRQPLPPTQPMSGQQQAVAGAVKAFCPMETAMTAHLQSTQNTKRCEAWQTEVIVDEQLTLALFTLRNTRIVIRVPRALMHWIQMTLHTIHMVPLSPSCNGLYRLMLLLQRGESCAARECAFEAEQMPRQVHRCILTVPYSCTAYATTSLSAAARALQH